MFVQRIIWQIGFTRIKKSIDNIIGLSILLSVFYSAAASVSVIAACSSTVVVSSATTSISSLLNHGNGDCNLGLIKEKILPYTLNERGVADLAQLVRRYPYELLLECIDIGVASYFQYDKEDF